MPKRVVYINDIKHRYVLVKPYGCMSFLFDIVMTVLTGGLWLIWIFVREMRRR